MFFRSFCIYTQRPFIYNRNLLLITGLHGSLKHLYNESATTTVIRIGKQTLDDDELKRVDIFRLLYNTIVSSAMSTLNSGSMPIDGFDEEKDIFEDFSSDVKSIKLQQKKLKRFGFCS